MKTQVPWPKRKTKELIVTFERDVLEGMEPLGTRIGQSLAGVELERRASECLEAIAEYLDNTKLEIKAGSDIEVAWIVLLSEIKNRQNIGPNSPEFATIDEWIIWARKYATP